MATRLTIEGVRLVLIPTEELSEKLCYEWSGKNRDETFIVYTDAHTGEEEDIKQILDAEDGICLLIRHQSAGYDKKREGTGDVFSFFYQKHGIITVYTVRTGALNLIEEASCDEDRLAGAFVFYTTQSSRQHIADRSI